jgi:hypothetical protein
MVETLAVSQSENQQQVTNSIFVNRLLALQSVSSALKKAQDIQEKSGLIKSSVSFMGNSLKWVNSFAPVQNVVQRVSSNDFVRDYAQKIDQLAADGVERVSAVSFLFDSMEFCLC